MVSRDLRAYNTIGVKPPLDQNMNIVFRFQSITAALLLIASLPVVAADAVDSKPMDKSGSSTALAEKKTTVIENSVVKVFATSRWPDFNRPWTKQPPNEVTGSGVVIEGKRILTCAHVVQYASQVQVQGNQAGDKLSATVEVYAPDIDLAILKLNDESFFDSHTPLQRATILPDIKDVVLAFGYPVGGTSLSITKGIVSRIEFTSYNIPVSGLRIQVDAAINPGNSGGPAVVGDKMIGLAFSHLGGSQNISYIIPCEEIDLFLKDIADGHYDGKPGFYDDCQTLENPALRSFLKLDKLVQGIIVHKPSRSDAAYPLKEWDIITKIGNTPVDDQGMIKLGSNMRIGFAYLVQNLATNGVVALTIVRDGKEMQVKLPVTPRPPLLVPGLNGTYPSYFVIGPLVFSTVTRESIGLVGGDVGLNKDWAGYLFGTGNPLMSRIYDKPAFGGERIVVISSPFLPHRLSEGYSNPMWQVVRSINGNRVKNLENVVEILRESNDQFIKIEFNKLYGGETIIFPRKEMVAATDEILTDNGIRSQGSADTLAVWNKKPLH